MTFRTLFVAVAAAAASSLCAAPKVGVLLKARTAFWGAVEKGAIEAGTRSGAEVVVKAPLAESDISVQIQLLNVLAAQGAQAIVIAPINKESLAAPVASLATKGVKIVVIDTPLTGESGPAFVGTDQTAAGRAAGELLARLVNAGDEVSFLKHAQTGGATTERENGALAAFRAVHPQNIVHADIYSGVEAGKELEKAQLVLTQYPNTKAILASSTPGTMAMLKALKEKNLAGAIKLVGFGFNLNPEVAEAIESGALSGWIAQQPGEMGRKGVEAAVKLLNGEEIPAVMHTEFAIITKENLGDAGIQALLGM